MSASAIAGRGPRRSRQSVPPPGVTCHHSKAAGNRRAVTSPHTHFLPRRIPQCAAATGTRASRSAQTQQSSTHVLNRVHRRATAEQSRRRPWGAVAPSHSIPRAQRYALRRWKAAHHTQSSCQTRGGDLPQAPTRTPQTRTPAHSCRKLKQRARRGKSYRGAEPSGATTHNRRAVTPPAQKGQFPLRVVYRRAQHRAQQRRTAAHRARPHMPTRVPKRAHRDTIAERSRRRQRVAGRGGRPSSGGEQRAIYNPAATIGASTHKRPHLRIIAAGQATGQRR